MKREIINRLFQKGYKRVFNSKYFINKEGLIINGETETQIKPHHLIIGKKHYKIEKLILMIFANEKIRSGTVKHIDGNKKNRSVENLEYVSKANLIHIEKINIENLYLSVRCFYRLKKNRKLKISDIETKTAFQFHIEKTNYIAKNQNRPFLQVFIFWLYNSSDSKEITSKFNISHADSKKIIHSYINHLTDEIINYQKTGIYEILPFINNKSDQINKTSLKLGAAKVINKKIELPESVIIGFRSLHLPLPNKPNFENLKNASENFKILIWLNRCSERVKIGLELTGENEKLKELFNDLLKIINLEIQNIDLMEK